MIDISYHYCMHNETLYILAEDKHAAQARMAELEKEIQDLGPEFYDVFNQSSETWHDNAPFDALRDRQSVLAAELQNLRNTLRRAAVSVPKPKKNIVGIGARVTVYNTALAKDFHYFIVGDWTYRVGEEIDGAVVVSAKAPLAQALLGHKVGYTAQFKHPLVITAIQYSNHQ
jgi:transcription elongation GreA/GreB family factor